MIMPMRDAYRVRIVSVLIMITPVHDSVIPAKAGIHCSFLIMIIGALIPGTGILIIKKNKKFAKRWCLLLI